MACFIVPLVQAIATSACRKAFGKDSFAGRHIASLELMLWGGSVMLIVDHIINGELTWRFPFITALGETGGWSIVLREMLMVGVPMSVIITAVWVIYGVVKDRRTLQQSTK